MKLIDWILLAAVVAVLAFAVHLSRRRAKGGGCHDCGEADCCAKAKGESVPDCCREKTDKPAPACCACSGPGALETEKPDIEASPPSCSCTGRIFHPFLKVDRWGGAWYNIMI